MGSVEIEDVRRVRFVVVDGDRKVVKMRRNLERKPGLD